MEKVSRFDRISRRGVHLPFEGVQPGSKGVQIPKGVQSERLDCPDKLELSIYAERSYIEPLLRQGIQ